jgi:hypothetical protein
MLWCRTKQVLLHFVKIYSENGVKGYQVGGEKNKKQQKYPPPPNALFPLLNTMVIKKVNAICSYSFNTSPKRQTGNAIFQYSPLASPKTCFISSPLGNSLWEEYFQMLLKPSKQYLLQASKTSIHITHFSSTKKVTVTWGISNHSKYTWITTSWLSVVHSKNSQHVYTAAVGNTLNILTIRVM